MGFLSRVISMIKNVVKRIVAFVGGLINKIFGAPWVFAIFMLVLAVFTCGATLTALMANPMLFLTSGPFLAGAVLNVVTTVLSAIFPGAARVFAVIAACISILYGGVYAWNTIFDTSHTVAQLISNVFPSIACSMWATVALGTVGMWATLTSITNSGNPEFAETYVDVVFKPVEIIGDIADVIVDEVVGAATSSLLGLALAAGAVYFGFKWVTTKRERRDNARQLSEKEAVA